MRNFCLTGLAFHSSKRPFFFTSQTTFKQINRKWRHLQQVMRQKGCRWRDASFPFTMTPVWFTDRTHTYNHQFNSNGNIEDGFTPERTPWQQPTRCYLIGSPGLTRPDQVDKLVKKMGPEWRKSRALKEEKKFTLTVTYDGRWIRPTWHPTFSLSRLYKAYLQEGNNKMKEGKGYVK